MYFLHFFFITNDSTIKRMFVLFWWHHVKNILEDVQDFSRNFDSRSGFESFLMDSINLGKHKRETRTCKNERNSTVWPYVNIGTNLFPHNHKHNRLAVTVCVSSVSMWKHRERDETNLWNASTLIVRTRGTNLQWNSTGLHKDFLAEGSVKAETTSSLWPLNGYSGLFLR